MQFLMSRIYRNTSVSFDKFDVIFLMPSHTMSSNADKIRALSEVENEEDMLDYLKTEFAI